MMEIFLKIAAAVVLGLMLFYLWPVYKQWQEDQNYMTGNNIKSRSKRADNTGRRRE